MSRSPFIIYALPRSRTAWLSAFLTYRDWTCYHEQAVHMRSIADMKGLFSWRKTGTVETGVAQGWRLIKHYVPNIKTVVIRRNVDDVIASSLSIDMSAVAVFDEAKLRKNMEYGDRMLQQIAKQPGILSFNYADLSREDVCAAIFEYCLPYNFDRAWWKSLCKKNIQIDVKEFMKSYLENRPGIDGFKKKCKAEMMHLARAGLLKNGGTQCHPHY